MWVIVFVGGYIFIGACLLTSLDSACDRRNIKARIGERLVWFFLWPLVIGSAIMDRVLGIKQ